MTANPFRDATEKADRVAEVNPIGVAEVANVADDAGHVITIEPLTKVIDQTTVTDGEPADVLVRQRGDVALPNEGDIVVYSHFDDGTVVVLGTLYGYRDEVRAYAADERHVGSDDGAGVFLHGPFASAPRVSDDPDDAPDGAVWYRDDLDEYRGVESGTTVTFDTTNV
jgi:hypothetical protein